VKYRTLNLQNEVPFVCLPFQTLDWIVHFIFVRFTQLLDKVHDLSVVDV